MTGTHTERDPRRPTLRGDLVTLRAAGDGDAALLVAILEEPEVAEWWRRSEWERVDEARAATFAIVWRGAGGPAHSGAAPRASAGAPPAGPAPGAVIGCIQYGEEEDPDYRSAAVDIFVSAAVHGRGAGSDAMRTLVAWLIDERGHHRLTVDPAAANRRAIHVYEKLGFRPVGVLRRYERVEDGMWRDALLMDLLAEDFARG